jgi:hypothetical protein
LLLFACDIVRVTQFLHTRGPIAILGKIVHNALRNAVAEGRRKG